MVNATRNPAFPDFGFIRIIEKPAPDAEDRLRRLFILLLGKEVCHDESA